MAWNVAFLFVGYVVIFFRWLISLTSLPAAWRLVGNADVVDDPLATCAQLRYFKADGGG